MNKTHRKLLGYHQIISDIYHKRALIFVGAGLSKHYLDMPGWRDLIDYLWSQTNEKRGRWKKDFKDDPYKEMSCLAKIIFKEKKKKSRDLDKNQKDRFLKWKIAEYLQEQFNKTQFKQKQWSRFVNLGFPIWVTTNFDTLLETHLPNCCTLRRGKYRQDMRRIMRKNNGIFPCSSGQPLVYKIHGCVNDALNMVVTKEDVDSFTRDDLYMKSVLATQMIERSALVLGYSLMDPNINELIQDINSEINRIDPTVEFNKVFFYVDKQKTKKQTQQWDRRIAELNEMGFLCLPYKGFTEFCSIVESIQKKLPDHLAKSQHIKQFFDRAVRYAQFKDANARWFGLSGMDPFELRAFFGIGLGVVEAVEWFKRYVRPIGQKWTLNDWTNLFETLVREIGDRDFIDEFVDVPDGTAFQEFYRFYRNAIATMPIYIAETYKGKNKDGPVERVVGTLIRLEKVKDTELLELDLHYALLIRHRNKFHWDRHKERLLQALPVVANFHSLPVLEAVLDLYIEFDLLNEVVKGITGRRKNKPFAYLNSLGRILKIINDKDPRLYKRLWPEAIEQVKHMGIEECREFFGSESPKELVQKNKIDKNLVHFLFS